MRAMSLYKLTVYTYVCHGCATLSSASRSIPSVNAVEEEHLYRAVVGAGPCRDPASGRLDQTRRTRTSSERSATESTGWRGG